MVTAGPTVVLRNGAADRQALRRQRLTETELLQAVRSSGFGGLDQVAAVVLETDGTLSVISHDQLGDGSALREIEGWPHRTPS